MAYIFDGLTGKVDVLDYTMAVGDVITTPTITYDVEERSYILSRSSSQYLRFDISGLDNEIEINDGSNIFQFFTNSLVVNSTYKITITRTSASLYDISMVVDGDEGAPLTDTFASTIGLRYYKVGADLNNSQNLQGTMTGPLVFGTTARWDFDSAPIDTNKIEDTIGSNDAIFNAGVTFSAPSSPDITFTNFGNDAFIAVNSISDQTAQFTVSGTIENLAVVSEIEWQRGAGAWVSLIVSPANSWTSPSISITGRDSISFRSTDEPGTIYTYMNVGAAYTMAREGQSNSSMRGDNNQVYVGDFAYNILANGDYGELVDPYSTFSDGSSLGSSMPLLSTSLLSVGILPAFVPNGLGSQSLSAMLKGGANYTNLTNSIAGLINGVNEIQFIQGKADLATNPATYEANLNLLVNDLFADFGVLTRITLFADISAGGTDIRTAQQNVINSNANAIYGGDGLIAMPSGNLHFQTNTELQNLADEMFMTMVTSTLNLAITGIPDGSFMTVLDDGDGTRIQRQNETYTSEAASITVGVIPGTTVKGYVDDATNPSSNAAYIEGITV